MATTQRQPAAIPRQTGYVHAMAAYFLWGGLPLFFAYYMTSHPVDLLAWRVVMSLGVTLLAVVVLAGARQRLRTVVRTRRDHLLLILAGHLIAINWGVYIYAVAVGRVLEASLGYFINPLVTILLGVVLLGERLRPLQWVAIACSGVAVVVLTVEYGRLPWISLTLACSFALYSLVKNKTGPSVDALSGLTVETLWLALPSTAWIVAASLGLLGTAGGIGIFATYDLIQGVSLPAIGLATVVPLLFFAAAAARLPLSTIGMFQYIAPISQFLLGYFVFTEDMSTGRWVGFGLVWVAVSILILDVIRQRRQNPTLRFTTSQTARQEKVDYQA